MSSPWESVRGSATAARAAALGGEPGGVVSPATLIERVTAQQGIMLQSIPAWHPMLYGAQALYDPDYRTIWYDAALHGGRLHFVLAHEFAHYFLAHGAVISGERDYDAAAAEEPTRAGIQTVEGYSPFDLVERGANVWAREFLLPPEVIAPWFRDRTWGGVRVPTVAALAARLAVPEAMVRHQLSRALLLPPLITADVPAVPADVVPPDASQHAAAIAPGPVLVEAGPGTGKTRTLVARVAYLLDSGAQPESLLVLTYSNRAAGELRERIARARPDAAPRIWAGTIHAFALELLRKYGAGKIAALQPGFGIVDSVEARMRFEEAVVGLDLRHYANLADPTRAFPDFLRAISRAKDERADPATYAQFVAAMPAGVERERADEVARAYAAYQAMLRDANGCDYGDLLMYAVALLEDAAVCGAVRGQYQHLLVDEYQDVNRATRDLLRLLAGDGAGLWAVGDPRQAIYGFRGASYGTMDAFRGEYPGATVVSLRVNYRSRPQVVTAFAGFAATMALPAPPAWVSSREDDPGTVVWRAHDDTDSEAEAMAREMIRLRDAGVPFREQAVLCRTHAVLGRVGAALAARDMPVLYLGDLFERPEIRDLLALVSLVTDADGRGLVRVGRLPAYDVPPDDLARVLRAAWRDKMPFPAALALGATEAGISAAGRAGVARIAADLSAAMAGDAGPALLLARYVFDRDAYLPALVAERGGAGMQRRLALYQFLEFVHGYGQRTGGVSGADACAAMLRYVRSIEIAGEDRQYGQLPAWADSIEAVRLLTVHAAKGLEFAAVFVPHLRTGVFPSSRSYDSCPPPPGLIPAPIFAREPRPSTAKKQSATQPTAAPERDETAADAEAQRAQRLEEERCLFFVALSRAREYLAVSCGGMQERQRRNPSEFFVHFDLQTAEGAHP